MTPVRSFGFLGLACLLACACGRAEKPEPLRAKSPLAQEETLRPLLRLMIVSDLEGTLEPCGCTEQSQGGIDQLAAAIAELRHGAEHSLLIVAGDLLAKKGETVRAQDALSEEVLLALLGRLSPDVIAASQRNVVETGAALEKLAALTHKAVLTSQPLPGSELARASAVVSVSDVAVGVVSASAGESAREIERLRALGARLIIGLAENEASLRADVIVRLGHARERPATQTIADSVEVRGGGDAGGLWVIDAWPAKHTQAHLTVATASYHALSPSSPRDPAVRVLLDQLFAHIASKNLERVREASEARAGAASYVGSSTCAACHTQAFFWWQGSAHGRAFASLKSRHRELDLDCIGCHVTGYGEPGGASLAQLSLLENVGCESCHGPGSLHADDPRRALSRTPSDAVCTHCHDASHSDGFSAPLARARLRAPGHAAP